MTKTKKIVQTVVLVLFGLIAAALLYLFSVNTYIKHSTYSRIVSPEQAANFDADCILVLGCGVWGDRPSHMLEDRLLEGVNCYNLSAAPKLLMSGDHGSKDYDEVNVMKNFALEQGVPSEDIFMDHAGFSTYDSLYRARDVFQAKKVVIVTQEYHLYRALYIAEKLGLEACGVPSDPRVYSGQLYRDFREVLARNKDFFSCMFFPEPAYLGEAIPVSGNGDRTAG